MIIKEVEIKNFRSIKEEKIRCEYLTAILGRNGAGKSNFLHAINYFYNISAPASEEDFFARNINLPIEIRVTYGDLRDEEKEEFKPYIYNEKLIITKRFINENGHIFQRYYAATLQIPEFAEIRKIQSKRERINAWKKLIEDHKQFNELTSSVRSWDEIEQLMTTYEINHQELKQLIEKEEQFFGPKNIGGGKLDKYTKLVFIPAVREASEEVTGKKSAIYQLLDMIVLREINAREDIKKFKTEFEEKVKKLYSSKNLTELSKLGDSITQTLEKFAPGSKLNLEWDEITPPEIPIPDAKATLVEDNFEGEITHKGHGLQRALIVTLLQHLSIATPIKILENETTINTEEVKTKTIDTENHFTPDLILLFEEPELYLHPSRCRYLSNLLCQLSEEHNVGLGYNNQIIYTSHSPYFIDLHRFDQIRIVRKVPLDNSNIPQSKITSFSIEQASHELSQIANIPPDKFTRESFNARALPIMNTIVNEGFFADVVVIVEGVSDVCALWKIQEILRKNWIQLGIVVIPAGGKNNIDRPVVIFNGFSIPTYFIFDGDAHLIGTKKESEAKKRNHRYLKLAKVKVEDFPDTQVYPNWAVFKTNIEETIKEEIGNDNFYKIREKVANDLGYDKVKLITKNMEGISKFIEEIYIAGYKVPTLEKIVNKITDLHNLNN